MQEGRVHARARVCESERACVCVRARVRACAHLVACHEVAHNVERALPAAIATAAALHFAFERGGYELGESDSSGLRSCFTTRAAFPLQVAALLSCQCNGVALEQRRRQVVAVAHLLRDEQLGVGGIEGGGCNGGDGEDGTVGAGAGVAQGARARAGAGPHQSASLAQLGAHERQDARADLRRGGSIRAFIAGQMLHEKREQSARVLGVRVQELMEADLVLVAQLLDRLAEHVAHAEARALLACSGKGGFRVPGEVVASKGEAVAGCAHQNVGLKRGERHALGDVAARVPHGDEKDAIDFAVGHGEESVGQALQMRLQHPSFVAAAASGKAQGKQGCRCRCPPSSSIGCFALGGLKGGITRNQILRTGSLFRPRFLRVTTCVILRHCLCV